MEADIYTLSCIPNSQALYIKKDNAQSLGGLCLCNPPPAVVSDVPHPIPWPCSHGGWQGAALPQAAAVGLACSLTTDAFSASMARVHPAAEVSSEFSQSSTVVPALHSSWLMLSLPAKGCAGGWQHLGRVWS